MSATELLGTISEISGVWLDVYVNLQFYVLQETLPLLEPHSTLTVSLQVMSGLVAGVVLHARLFSFDPSARS